MERRSPVRRLAFSTAGRKNRTTVPANRFPNHSPRGVLRDADASLRSSCCVAEEAGRKGIEPVMISSNRGTAPRFAPYHKRSLTSRGDVREHPDRFRGSLPAGLPVGARRGALPRRKDSVPGLRRFAPFRAPDLEESISRAVRATNPCKTRSHTRTRDEYRTPRLSKRPHIGVSQRNRELSSCDRTRP
jgi:hypothetical protein